MRTTWVVPVLLALAVPALVLFAGAADAYVAQGHPWPGGVIRYYNGALTRRGRDGWAPWAT
jgi:hypothetical protein